MPPKNQDLVSEAPKQALIVPSTFDPHFVPLDVSCPRSLIPLCNLPLIEYTLELIATSSVKEVFVMDSGRKLAGYLNHSKWCRPTNKFKLHVIHVPDATNLGDVLREVDVHGIIKGDFILFDGLVVSNLSLDALLESHRKARKEAKNLVLTMILQQTAPHHDLRLPASLFAFSPKTHNLLHHQDLSNPRPRPVRFRADIIQNNLNISIRNDLAICGIYACAHDLPAMFAENFDFRDIKNDFVRGVLESELRTKDIRVCFCQDNEYAAVVGSTRAYDAVSKDVMSRWTYPFVPDANISKDTHYQARRKMIYQESQDVYLARSAKVLRNSTIATGVKVGKGTVIRDSVLGRNVLVGENCELLNTYILDDSVVEDRCQISHAFIASNVLVKEDSQLVKGTIVGPHCIIGPKARTSPFSRIAVQSIASDESVNLQQEWETEESPEHLGNHSNAVRMTLVTEYSEDSDGTESDNEEDDVWSLRHSVDIFSIGNDKSSVKEAPTNEIVFPDDVDTEDSESEDSVSVSADSASSEEAAEGREKVGQHQEEVLETFKRAYENNHSIEESALELNGLKMAMNLSFADLRRSMLPYLFGRLCTLSAPSELKEQLKKWVPLIARLLVHGHQEQLEILWELEEFFETRSDGTRCKWALSTVRYCYELDAVEEDAIVQWYQELRNADLKKQVEPFIQWLQEAEEESD